MTLPFNPLRAAELARQALDDDSKMTPGEWTVSDDDQFSAIVVGSDEKDVCTFDFYEHRPDEQRDEAHAVARSRNALREMAEQLVAAVEEVERLQVDRARLGTVLSKTNEALNRAGCYSALYYWEHIDAIAAERDALKAEVEKQARRITILVMDQRRQLPEDVLRDIADAHTERDSLRASCEQLKRERDELRQRADASWQSFLRARDEVAKMRPVYESAIAHYRCQGEEDWNALMDAIDSALSSTHQAGTK